MAYFEYTIKALQPIEQEVLCAFLSESGFDSFWENENELRAYSASGDKLKLVNEILQNAGIGERELSVAPMPDINWNEEWESQFQPVEIASKVRIRASFHPKSETVIYDIIIHPKMAFGTGHHATTAGVMELMLNIDLHGKTVLDAGCGTGVLAIFAKMLGSSAVTAFDNDAMAVNNAIENAELNGMAGKLQIELADLVNFERKPFDVVLANITRNTITAAAGVLAALVNDGGLLIVSGFYLYDLPMVQDVLGKFNFQLTETGSSDSWVAAIFVKT